MKIKVVNQFHRCLDCPKGKFSPRTASASCESCEAGKYTALDRQTMFLHCKVGTYSNEEGALECTPCSSGSLSDISGSTICTDCTIEKHKCMECAPGKYIGATRCVECPEGTYSLSGHETCNICKENYYLDIMQDTCVFCPLGTQSRFNSTGIESCKCFHVDDCCVNTIILLPDSVFLNNFRCVKMLNLNITKSSYPLISSKIHSLFIIRCLIQNLNS